MRRTDNTPRLSGVFLKLESNIVRTPAYARLNGGGRD